jgi:hypothetical protein
MLACVGFVLTAQTAFATNESSYEWGYKYGFGNYRWFLKGDCEQPVVYALDQSGVDYLCGSLPALINASGYASVPITNLTACQDGYHNGWKDWCKTDQINCALLVTLGVYPQLNAYTSISQELNWKVTVPIIAPHPTV